jgi:hypothetical protein
MFPIVEIALDGASLEQRCGVFGKATDAAVAIFEGQNQIELSRGVRRRD